MDTGEMVWIIEMIFVAKHFSDAGRLDALKDVLRDVGGRDDWDLLDTEDIALYYMAALDAVFEEHACYYNEPRPGRAMRDFDQSEVHVFRDPLMFRFAQLCEAYEEQLGIVEIEDPFIKECREAVARALNLPSYAYGYSWMSGTKGPKQCKLVFFEEPEFDRMCELIPGLLEFRLYLEGAVARLEKALEEVRGKIISFAQEKKKRQRRKPAVKKKKEAA